MGRPPKLPTQYIQGSRAGKLTYTGRYFRKNGYWIGEFVCDCGNTCHRPLCRLRPGTRGGSCGCVGVNGWKKRITLSNKFGDDYPFYLLFSKVATNKYRIQDVAITITPTELREQFIAQKGKCAYTGLKLRLPLSATGCNSPDVASIDRIDPDHGYIRGNVQFVAKSVNIMKNRLRHEEFVALCNMIARRHPLDDMPLFPNNVPMSVEKYGRRRKNQRTEGLPNGPQPA